MAPSLSGPAHAEVAVAPDSALAQVERILESATFKGSRRCSLFLRYVSRLSFQENHEPPKERILGVEIFGRLPGYDTNEDPVVRNTAGEVRKRLAQYYQITGHEAEVRVELPVGSYVPQFTAPPLAARQEGVPVKERASWRWWAACAAAFGVLIVLSVALWPQSALDAFWVPIMKTPGPVLVCIGQPVAFNFAGPLEAEMDRNVNTQAWFAEHADQSVRMRDILPFRTRYVTLMDAIALSRITSVLNANSKPFHIRGGDATSFSDLRDNATVLIGAFTNDWTLKVGGKTRFYFDRDEATGWEGIRDRQNPANRSWGLVRPWPEWNVNQDYAIVSRIFAQDTGRVLVTAAGITQYGTSAAGEFATNPVYLQEVFRQMTNGQKAQNIEVVLRTRVVEHVAGPPQVLAVHSW